jgi:dihydroneopterin aldolase
VEGQPHNLLESVAKNISDTIFLNYDIETISVTIKKPDVPIDGANLDYAGITLTRNKGK